MLPFLPDLPSDSSGRLPDAPTAEGGASVTLPSVLAISSVGGRESTALPFLPFLPSRAPLAALGRDVAVLRRLRRPAPLTPSCAVAGDDEGAVVVGAAALVGLAVGGTPVAV